MNSTLFLFPCQKPCPRSIKTDGNFYRIRLGAVGLHPGFSKQGKIGGIRPTFYLLTAWFDWLPNVERMRVAGIKGYKRRV